MINKDIIKDYILHKTKGLELTISDIVIYGDEWIMDGISPIIPHICEDIKENMK